MNRSRLIEIAFLLPWAGLFLLTPPMVLILHDWSQATGFPMFIIYVFVCWMLLIVLGAVVSARLARFEDALSGDGGKTRREDEAPVRSP